MARFYFRNTFAARYLLGPKRKRISLKTQSQISEDAPILVLDIDYLGFLLTSRQELKSEPIDVRLFLIQWINAVSVYMMPKGIIATYSEFSSFTKEIIDILTSFTITIINEKITDYIYSMKIKEYFTGPLCLVTNNLTTWAISNNTANLYFAAIDSNNRALVYNNDKGLEFFSRFILTNKIINSLKFDTLRYLNLQYLYILLLFINFTNTSKDSEFFFDSKYLKSLEKHRSRKKSFSRSNGFGLDLIHDAHKTIRYAFLTKPEFMDYFLLNGGHEWRLQLKRLQLLVSFDIAILSKLHDFYLLNYQILTIPVKPVDYTLTSSFPELRFSVLCSKNPNKIEISSEISALVALLRKYTKKYTNEDITIPALLLPEEKRKEFIEIISTSLPEKADNIYIETTEDFVTSLLNGIFDGES